MLTKNIKPLFWLWVPILWIAAQLIAEFTISDAALLEFHSENGLHEWLQFLLLGASFYIACHCQVTMDKVYNIFLRLWLFIIIFGCFYVAGEEISWGQSIFKWATPENWKAINYQDETNLHNTSRLFNQIPKLFLEVGVIIGGIIMPLILKFKPHWLPKRLSIIYPPAILCVTAITYSLAKFSQKASKVFFEQKIFQRASEVEELYLYFFVLLYTYALSREILRSKVKTS